MAGLPCIAEVGGGGLVYSLSRVSGSGMGREVEGAGRGQDAKGQGVGWGGVLSLSLYICLCMGEVVGGEVLTQHWLKLFVFRLNIFIFA